MVCTTSARLATIVLLAEIKHRTIREKVSCFTHIGCRTELLLCISKELLTLLRGAEHQRAVVVNLDILRLDTDELKSLDLVFGQFLALGNPLAKTGIAESLLAVDRCPSHSRLVNQFARVVRLNERESLLLQLRSQGRSEDIGRKRIRLKGRVLEESGSNLGYLGFRHDVNRLKVT